MCDCLLIGLVGTGGGMPASASALWLRPGLCTASCAAGAFALSAPAQRLRKLAGNMRYASITHCVAGYAGKPAGVSDTLAGLLTRTCYTSITPSRYHRLNFPQ